MPKQEEPPELNHVAPGWFKRRWEKLTSYLRRNMPIDSADIVWIDAGRGRRGYVTFPPRPEVTPFPFKLIDVSADGIFNIRVIYGEVNGQAPSGFSPGDTPAYILDSVGTTGYIWLGVNVNSDLVTLDSIFVDFGDAVPSDDFGALNFYHEIGSYATADGNLVIANAIISSQGFELCGGGTPKWWAD